MLCIVAETGSRNAATGTSIIIHASSCVQTMDIASVAVRQELLKCDCEQSHHHLQEKKKRMCELFAKGVESAFVGGFDK